MNKVNAVEIKPNIENNNFYASRYYGCSSNKKNKNIGEFQRILEECERQGKK